MYIPKEDQDQVKLMPDDESLWQSGPGERTDLEPLKDLYDQWLEKGDRAIDEWKGRMKAQEASRTEAPPDVPRGL